MLHVPNIKRSLLPVSACPNAESGPDLVAGDASASITHVQKAVPKLKNVLLVIQAQIQLQLALLPQLLSKMMASYLGDIMWAYTYRWREADYDYGLQALLSCDEVLSRASAYAAGGNLQCALYMREQLHRVQTTAFGPLLGDVDGDIGAFACICPADLFRLYEQQDNFFQAELMLEDAIIFHGRGFAGEAGFTPDACFDDAHREKTITSLIDLYKRFQARLLTRDPRLTSQNVAALTLRRAVRIDNEQLWQGLSSASLIPPFNHDTLVIAKERNALNLIQLCLEREASVPDQPDVNETNLREAAQGESARRAEDSTGSFSTRETGEALHEAIRRGSLDDMVSLLSHGANIEARTTNNETPLILATYFQRLEMVRYLLETGADITARTSQGWTAFDYTYSDSWSDHGIYRLLENHRNNLQRQESLPAVDANNLPQPADMVRVGGSSDGEDSSDTITPTVAKIENHRSAHMHTGRTPQRVFVP
ncbi:MAG: hypothetical protein Q9218_004479 [Villophora microphyllina]